MKKIVMVKEERVHWRSLFTKTTTMGVQTKEMQAEGWRYWR